MSSNSKTNAQNAQHSTGPRTEAGKKRSSLNALRHGLTSQIIVLASEDLDAYKAMTSEFHRDFSPQGILETKLVQSLAESQWRLDRCTAIEHNLFALTYGITAASQAERLQARRDEAILLAEIRKTEPEEIPDPADIRTDVTSGLELANAFHVNANDLRILGAHERHLQRYFQSTLKTLRELQAERRKSDHEKMKNAAALQQAAKRKGVSYDPAADGFVFSVKDIEMFIACEERVKEAHKPGFGG